MRHPILLFLLFLTSCCVAQSDTTLTYTEVVKVDSGIAKAELFSRARLWFSDAFKDSKAVLEISDKESGELVGKGTIKYSSAIFLGSATTSGWIHFRVKILVKDGRYKYEVTAFQHEGSKSYGQYGSVGPQSFGLITSAVECPDVSCPSGATKWCTRVWNDIKDTINSNIPGLIILLKQGMAKPAAGKDDW